MRNFACSSSSSKASPRAEPPIIPISVGAMASDENPSFNKDSVPVPTTEGRLGGCGLGLERVGRGSKGSFPVGCLSHRGTVFAARRGDDREGDHRWCLAGQPLFG